MSSFPIDPVRRSPWRSRAAAAVFGLSSLAVALAVAAADRAPLFPSPFVVEHRVTTPGDGAGGGAVVIDWYAGSRIVSVRPDGSRLVVDFDRREAVEIRPADGSWSVTGFDRFAELRRRLRGVEGPVAPPAAAAAAGDSKPATIRVEESKPEEKGMGDPSAPLLRRPGIRRFRATADRGASGSLEAWLDPSVRLSKEARSALETLEVEVLGMAVAPTAVSPGRLAAAIREKGEGAFPVRTRRTVGGAGHVEVVEDVVLRLEPVAALPAALLAIPDGYRQVPPPLEGMVRELEERADPVGTARTAAAREGK